MPPIAPDILDLETAQRLRQTIARLYRRLRAWDATGVPPSRVSALLHLDRHGPMRLSALAESEGLNPTMLSRMVGDLVADGLVERRSDPNDRRAAWAEVTVAGHELAERLRRERTRVLIDALERMAPGEARRVLAALPALEALADRLLEDGA